MSELPRPLGDPLRELQWLRETAALIPDHDHARIRISGADAADYLERRLPQSIRALDNLTGRRAFQLSGDGAMEADFPIYRAGDGFDLIVPADQADAIAAVVEKFVIMEEVNLERAPETAFALAGPKADEALRRAGCGDGLEPWRMVEDAKIEGRACRLYRDGRWTSPFYHAAAPRETAREIAAALAEACAQIGGGAAGPEALDYRRIELGVAAFGRDLTEATNPIVAALEADVDFDKGCFPGQEALARIRNLGHPARVLARFSFDGEAELENGDRVLPPGDGDRAEAGRIASARSLPGLDRTLALGYLKWNFRGLTEGIVSRGNQTLRAEIECLSRFRPQDKSKVEEFSRG